MIPPAVGFMLYTVADDPIVLTQVIVLSVAAATMTGLLWWTRADDYLAKTFMVLLGGFLFAIFAIAMHHGVATGVIDVTKRSGRRRYSPYSVMTVAIAASVLFLGGGVWRLLDAVRGRRPAYDSLTPTCRGN